MAVNLSPIGNGFQFFTSTGVPLAGGLLYTYQAGSSTPLASYTDTAGLFANTNPIVMNADGRPPSEIWLTAGFNYKFVLSTAGNVQIASYDNIYGILGTAPAVAPIPSGSIVLWSGSIGSIPVGWYLCDGTNGTPNLKNSFIVGAGGSVDSVLPTHSHTATSTSTVTDPGHIHTALSNGQKTGETGGPYNAQSAVGNNGRADPDVSTVSAFTGVTVATTTTTQATGVSPTNANLPPYYALAYIQKA